MEERTLAEVIQDGFSFGQSNLHTITIGRITAVNDTTINVQPVIPRVVDDVVRPLPEIPNVPPIFLFGGSSSETWPLAVGDPCILFIIERSTDRFFSGEDNGMPVEPRMHDLSDCIALVGIKTFGEALIIPQVITRVGDTHHTGNAVHIGDTDQTGDTTQTGDVTLDGDQSVTGNISYGTIDTGGVAGVSGTLNNAFNQQLATVVNGIITEIF